MPTFQDFMNELKPGIKDLADGTWKQYSQQAQCDGNDFVDYSKEKLQEYTEYFVLQKIDEDEYKSLLGQLVVVGELGALKQAGLAGVQLDRFSNDLVSVIVSTAIKVFL